MGVIGQQGGGGGKDQGDVKPTNITSTDTTDIVDPLSGSTAYAKFNAQRFEGLILFNDHADQATAKVYHHDGTSTQTQFYQSVLTTKETELLDDEYWMVLDRNGKIQVAVSTTGTTGIDVNVIARVTRVWI